MVFDIFFVNCSSDLDTKCSLENPGKNFAFKIRVFWLQSDNFDCFRKKIEKSQFRPFDRKVHFRTFVSACRGSICLIFEQTSRKDPVLSFTSLWLTSDIFIVVFCGKCLRIELISVTLIRSVKLGVVQLSMQCSEMTQICTSFTKKPSSITNYFLFVARSLHTVFFAKES